MEEHKTIVIRPIARNRFSGQSSYEKTSTVIGGAQLSQTGLYKTGLSNADETHFEQLLNLPKGTLSKRNAEFWGDLEIRLRNDKLTIFNIVSPLDEIKHKIMLEHDLIANDETQVVGNSSAKFYIYDPEAASKIEDAKMELEFTAIELFTQLGLDERKGMLMIYGKDGVDLMSETMVKTELRKFMNKDFSEFIRIVKSKETPTRALLANLLSKGYVKKKNNYFYNNEDLIGASTDEAVSWLTDMKNQAVVLALKNKLKPKKTKED